MNNGKIFEEEFKNSIPSWCWYYRLKDGTAAYGGNDKVRFQAKNICDCFVVGLDFTYLLELKSTNLKSLPFSNIKENQLKGLSEIRHPKIKTYFVICFRNYQKCFFIEANKVKSLADEGKKSISMKFCEENGIEIDMQIVKVRYKYDLKNILR